MYATQEKVKETKQTTTQPIIQTTTTATTLTTLTTSTTTTTRCEENGNTLECLEVIHFSIFGEIRILFKIDEYGIFK